MWIEYIQNNNFLKQLFKDVPELLNVEIERFNIDYYGKAIHLFIKLPQRIDEIPLKWKNNNYNGALIEIDFWDITQFTMSMDDYKKSNINIIKENHVLYVKIQGGINAKFVTEGGYIQNVKGYILE